MYNLKITIMKNVKKYPKKQLEKYSVVFIQLSLVLVLFVVYQVLEHKTVNKSFGVVVPDKTDEYVFLNEDRPISFLKEKKVVVKKSPPKVLILDVFETKKDDDPIIEDILPDLEPVEKTVINIENALNNYVDIEDPTPIEDVPFVLIEEAPVYKGCEGLSKEENKKCFVKSIQKFVIRRFDASLAQDLGLRSGKYKIFAQFVIGKDGIVNEIKIKAPHHKLEKEVNNLINKLPRFTPGMQRKVPVNVKFTLPIIFSVE